MENKMTGYASIDKPWMKYYEGIEFTPWPQATLYRSVLDANKDYLDETALIYFGRKYSYGQMFEQIDATANALKALGLEKGDVAIFSLVNTPEAVFALYGANKMGVVLNLVDPRSDVKTWKHYIEQVKAKVIVTLNLNYPIVEKAIEGTTVEKVVVVSVANSMKGALKLGYKLQSRKETPKITYSDRVLTWNQFIENGRGAQAEEAPYAPGTCSIMVHTGGTTGMPKTVMISDDRLTQVIWSYHWTGIMFARQQTWYNDLPPFIIYGFGICTHAVLLFGLQLILMPKFSPEDFPKWFKKYKPQHVAAVSEHFRQLIRDPEVQKMDLSFVVSINVGGDALPVEDEKQINQFFEERGCPYNMIKGYGMTEVTSGATSSSPTMGSNAPGSIGIPFYRVTVKIMDPDTLQELKYNEIGEIWINTPGVMLGYMNDQEATDEMLYTDENGDVWVRTSDLGLMTEDGMIYHKGRMRRIYITIHDGQGAKIFPQVPEDAMRKNADVEDVSVACRFMKDSTFYEPVAFVVKEKDSAKTDEQLTEELKKICEDEVPTYMHPVDYVYLDTLPLTKNGKVDFVTLEKQAADMLNA